MLLSHQTRPLKFQGGRLANGWQAYGWHSLRPDSHCCRAQRKRQAAPETLTSRPTSRPRTGSSGAARRKPALGVEAPTLARRGLETQEDDVVMNTSFDEALAGLNCSARPRQPAPWLVHLHSPHVKCRHPAHAWASPEPTRSAHAHLPGCIVCSLAGTRWL